MNPEEFKIMYQVECQHWWYLGMATITKAILNRWYSPKVKLRIFDAGCGTGATIISFLENYGTVTGCDISAEALNYCRLRKIDRILQASISNIPFKQQSFDLVSSFDVLSDIGISNDAISMKEFFRVLAPGGRVIIRLPAYDWLSSQHDNAVQTVKRYNSKQIASLLTQSGFLVEHISYANTILFPFALVYRMAGKFSRHGAEKTSDLSIEFKFMNQILKMILQFEAKPVAHIGLPYGLSIFAVGRKP